MVILMVHDCWLSKSLISIEKQKIKKDYSPRTRSMQEHWMLPCTDIGCYTQWGNRLYTWSCQRRCWLLHTMRLWTRYMQKHIPAFTHNMALQLKQKISQQPSHPLLKRRSWWASKNQMKAIIHINLYTVVKYARPQLPMYSRWGMQNPFFVQKGFVEKDFGLVWCGYSHTCNDPWNADQCCHVLMTCAIIFLIAFAHDLLVEYLHHHSELSILQEVIPGSTRMNTVKKKFRIEKHLQEDYGRKITPFLMTYLSILIFRGWIPLRFHCNKLSLRAVIISYWL